MSNVISLLKYRNFRPMKLTEAMHAVAGGATVVSAIGRRYTAAELAPKLLGKHAASFNDVGMTKAEREGEWRVDS